MEKEIQHLHKFGLVGKNISYSFSQSYFTRKFEELQLEGYSYDNYNLKSIENFKRLINDAKNLCGLNITIPYKEAIIPYLNNLDPQAEAIGAVNTIKFFQGKLKGYNTDTYGFKKAIKPLLEKHHTHALILGTGGASKAIKHVLDELGVKHTLVSRTPHQGQLSYAEITEANLEMYTVLINSTPLGTYPNSDQKPNIPYHYIKPNALLFDLTYNPTITAFMKMGEAQGATVSNGLIMLEQQAEKAWEIWTS